MVTMSLVMLRNARDVAKRLVAQSLIPYGNEPEGLGVSQPVGDVGIGLSGAQMLS